MSNSGPTMDKIDPEKDNYMSEMSTVEYDDYEEGESNSKDGFDWNVTVIKRESIDKKGNAVEKNILKAKINKLYKPLHDEYMPDDEEYSGSDSEDQSSEGSDSQDETTQPSNFPTTSPTSEGSADKEGDNNTEDGGDIGTDEDNGDEKASADTELAEDSGDTEQEGDENEDGNHNRTPDQVAVSKPKDEILVGFYTRPKSLDGNSFI